MKLLMALAAGLAGYCYYRGRPTPVPKAPARAEVDRWEGEGGNVPSVATPSAAPTPDVSFPEGDTNTRH